MVVCRAHLKNIRNKFISHNFLSSYNWDNSFLWKDETLKKYPNEVAVVCAILLLREQCEGRKFIVREHDRRRGQNLIWPLVRPLLQENGVSVEFHSAFPKIIKWVQWHWELMKYAGLFEEALIYTKGKAADLNADQEDGQPS